MDVGQVVSTVASQAVLLAALGWLIRSLISNSLMREAATFRAQLQRDTDTFKSQLTIDAHRQTTVFTQLHEQRGKIIAEIYALLTAAERAVSSMVAPFQPTGTADAKTLMNNSAHAIGAFRDNFAANRIWFPQTTCARADAVLTELLEVHNYFSIVARGGTDQADHVNSKAWSNSWERVKRQLPDLRGVLESDFRAILGVENGSPAASLPE